MSKRYLVDRSKKEGKRTHVSDHVFLPADATWSQVIFAWSAWERNTHGRTQVSRLCALQASTDEFALLP